jgi:hypothetical protein
LARRLNLVKQKLSKRKTYTPTDTSPVRSNCDHELNIPEDRESVHGSKTFDNNSEVNHSQHRENLNHKVSSTVYVLDLNGLPLMPTSQGKASHLLKTGKAKVVGRKPFVIQLNYKTGNNRQNITLGVDPGYKYLGLSAITNKKEIYAAEVILRTDVSKLIADKRMYRRKKRKALWHRQQRFLNRGIKKGWLAPSIQHKLDSILRIVKKIHNLLPINKIVIETAKFDIQKIKDPTISGSDYQEGEQKGFENVRQYVLYRDGYKCQVCKKHDVKLRVHHLESRMTGGNRPENLITLCEKCHGLVHAGKIELRVKKRFGYKAQTCISIICHRIIDSLKEVFQNVQETYGYITSEHRKELGIEKTHNNDAFCVAGGNSQERVSVLYYAQRRRNNRCLQLNRKGFKPSIRRQRYPIQPKDLIEYKGKKYLVTGTHSYGRRVLLNRKISVKSELIRVIKYSSGIYLQN